MSLYKQTLEYVEQGYSVIPVQGKKPALPWARYQVERAQFSDVHRWQRQGLLTGVGVVCGEVSQNLAVVDLDGLEAVREFHRVFPHLLNTYVVLSGSSLGQHLYYYTPGRVPTTRTKGFELRTDGCYVVAPPSPHESGRVYQVLNRAPVMLTDLEPVRKWIMDKIRANNPAPVRRENTPGQNTPGQNPLWVNAALKRALDDVRTAAANNGTGNHTLNAVAYRLARICANPNSGLSETDVKADLIDAASALSSRDGLRATLKTIESGWQAGSLNPVNIPAQVRRVR